MTLSLFTSDTHSVFVIHITHPLFNPLLFLLILPPPPPPPPPPPFSLSYQSGGRLAPPLVLGTAVAAVDTIVVDNSGTALNRDRSRTYYNPILPFFPCPAKPYAYIT